VCACKLQFNSLVLTGPVAALAKLAVEYFQLGIARNDPVLTRYAPAGKRIARTKLFGTGQIGCGELSTWNCKE